MRGEHKAQEWWQRGKSGGKGIGGSDVGRRHSDVIKVAELKGYTLPPSPSLRVWKVYEFMNTGEKHC